MKQKRRWIVPALAVALALVLVLALRPSPLPVSTAEVTRGAFVESVDEEGQTRLRETYTVSAPIAGYLQRVRPEPGDTVELGETLFRMEPHPAPALDARSLEQARENLAAVRARRQTAEANLATVAADAEFAASEYARYRELHDRGLVSTTEMERARAARDRQAAARRAAEYAVEVAGFEVESARAVLDIASGQRPAEDQPELEIRAPVAGVILRRHRCCEGTIAAGEAVVDVGSLDDLEVQVDLLSMAAVRVRPGMRVRLTGWGGDEVIEGRVRRVEPAGFTRVSALGVEEQRVPVIVDLDDADEAWRALGVGFRVEAEFILWEDDEVLQAPTSALFRREGDWAVFVVDDGRAALRRVERGRSSGLTTQIIDGLVAGERVITHPGDQVREGSRVRAD
ncbi:MAG: HlyD family efflux transporter periplasmic adaptor subunit [Gammaproteobacteria bacterium]|nr:HlyD family efflux transporter periplasmic adaptor subunit [Gammaproteobacteria bacterium]TVQ49178.1 MAG: HlyD family efflux transporter periplasmic adaptor subunit [Gammaproteobacteria bacterium]